jgi:hypothetical protein
MASRGANWRWLLLDAQKAMCYLLARGPGDRQVCCTPKSCTLCNSPQLKAQLECNESAEDIRDHGSEPGRDRVHWDSPPDLPQEVLGGGGAGVLVQQGSCKDLGSASP